MTILDYWTASKKIPCEKILINIGKWSIILAKYLFQIGSKNIYPKIYLSH